MGYIFSKEKPEDIIGFICEKCNKFYDREKDWEEYTKGYPVSMWTRDNSIINLFLCQHCLDNMVKEHFPEDFEEYISDRE